MNERNDNEPRRSDEIDELLGAYALDALDDAEQAEVEAHLADSPWARTEADRLNGAVDHLAAAEAPPMSPPDALWDRISASLPPRPERIPKPDTAADAGTPTAPSLQRPSPPDSTATPASEAPTDELARRRATKRPPLGAILLAAAAAVVVVVLIGVGLASRDSDKPATLAQQLQQEADRVADQPGSRTATLTNADGTVRVRVVVDQQGRGIVEPDGLAALPADKTYQLWSVDGATPVSLGLLGADPAVAVVGTGDAVQKMAITAEPASGSPGPTTEPVATGTLA
jgi:anti-sigma-K factor RskA